MCLVPVISLHLPIWTFEVGDKASWEVTSSSVVVRNKLGFVCLLCSDAVISRVLSCIVPRVVESGSLLASIIGVLSNLSSLTVDSVVWTITVVAFVVLSDLDHDSVDIVIACVLVTVKRR